MLLLNLVFCVSPISLVFWFYVSLLFEHLWDSENDISTSVLLSVVMPVHLVYAGTMVGAACRMRRPRSLHLKV